MSEKNLKELSYSVDFNINENGLDKALNVEKKIDEGFKGIGESIGKVDNTIGQMSNSMNGADKGAKNVAEALNGVSNSAEKANTQSKGIAETLKNFGSNVLGGIKGVADQLLGISNNSNKASQGAKNVADSFKNINSSGLDSYNQALDFAERKLEIIGSQYAQQYKIARQLYTEYNNSVESIGREAEATQKLHQQLLTAQAKELQLEQAVEKAGAAFEKQQELANGTSNSIGKAASEAKKLGENASGAKTQFEGLKTVSMGIGSVLGALGVVGVGYSAVNGIKSMTTAFMDFQQEMARAHAVMGTISNTDMTNLSNKAIQLSNTWGIGAKDIAGAEENLASNGLNVKGVLNSLQPTVLLATAGNIKMEDSANDVATALNNFGLGADKAQHVVDVYAKTAAKTASELPDIATAMKYIGPISDQVGWSLEKTSAAIGLLSNAGIKGSKSGTTLREVVSRLLKPSKDAADLMDSIGFSPIDKTTHKLKDLSTIIQELSKDFESHGLTDPAKKNSALEYIFGQEAFTGVSALFKQGPQAIDDLAKSLENADGSGKKMANTMNDTVAGSLNILKQNFTNAFITNIDKTQTGQSLKEFFNYLTDNIPTIDSIIGSTLNNIMWLGGKIADFIKPFKDNWKEVKPMLEGVLAGLLGFKVITGIVGTVSGLTKTFQGLSKTVGLLGFSASAGEIFLVVGAISALIGVMVYFYNTNKDFKDGVDSTFDALGQLKDIIMDDIVPVVGTFLSGAFQTVSNVFTDVMQIVGGVIQVFQGITDFVIGVFTLNWSKAWTGIKEIFGGVFQTIDGICKSFEDTALGSLKTVMATAQEAIDLFNKANNTKIAGMGSAGNKEGAAVSSGTGAISNYLKQDRLPTAVLGGYASGTDNATPGVHLVGENGPELLSFQGGEKVVPANITSSLLNETADSNVGDVVNQYDTAVTNLLPHFAEYGKEINTNMSTGIDQNAPIVATSTTNLTANTGAQLNNFAQGTYAYGTAVVSEINQGLNDSAGNLTATVQSLTDKVISQFKQGFGIHSPSRVMYGIGSYLMQGLVNGMTSKDMEGFITNWIGSMTSIAGGAVSGNLAGWITAAMALTGVGPEWYGPLATIIEHESGGDPNSINLWDSNAAAGHPSKGLMQLIDENMEEHHLPGMTNIYDPVSNIAAGIRLIQHDYGSVFNVPGIRALSQGRPYVGYETGTDNATAGLHWVGEKGPELVNFGGGETVYNHKDSMDMATASPYLNYGTANSSASVDMPININISVTDSGNPKQTAIEVTRQMEQKAKEVFQEQFEMLAIRMGYVPIGTS